MKTESFGLQLPDEIKTSLNGVWLTMIYMFCSSASILKQSNHPLTPIPSQAIEIGLRIYCFAFNMSGEIGEVIYYTLATCDKVHAKCCKWLPQSSAGGPLSVKMC